jgi:hypothetical protein
VGAINLAGALIVGPDTSNTGFPGNETSIPLIASNNDYAVSDTGLMNVASDDDYIPVPGVSEDGPVTNARLLYVRTNGALLIRITTPTAADTPQVLPVNGLLLMEFPEADPLQLLEVKGTARLEYLVAGQT